jgi:Nucleotide modification associated domain 2
MSNCVTNRRARTEPLPGKTAARSYYAGFSEVPMARHYSYRVDHDLGFAPHIEGRLCTVCGCKRTTIERWAKKGSWIVGIGGKGTGKTDALIYAMKVEKTPSYRAFRKAHPAHASYLSGCGIPRGAPVLLSTHFYYFGDHAQFLPPELSHLIHTTQGCKRLSDDDIASLNDLVLSGYRCGAHGRPNNRILKSLRSGG